MIDFSIIKKIINTKSVILSEDDTKITFPVGKIINSINTMIFIEFFNVPEKGMALIFADSTPERNTSSRSVGYPK